MGFWSSLFGTSTSEILVSGSDLIQSIYTSPGVKLSKEEALQKAKNVVIKKQQERDIAQIKANGSKKDPAWKSGMAWVCIIGISLDVIVRPIFIGIMTHTFPNVEIGTLVTMISGMMGMSTLHLVDKLKNK